MNRREFHTGLGLAFGATAFALTPLRRAAAHVVTEPQTQQSYRYRLRYVRKANTYSIWMRVSDPKRLDADVPVSLILSTDISGLNVLDSSKFIARALDSHIVRQQIAINKQAWSPGSPLYARLRIGTTNTPSKAWKLWKA
jgi:hypothetical protein